MWGLCPIRLCHRADRSLVATKRFACTRMSGLRREVPTLPGPGGHSGNEDIGLLPMLVPSCVLPLSTGVCCRGLI